MWQIEPLFIVIDGIDGTGKSTQVERLAQWLCDNGVRTETTKEPGGTAVGAIIRSILVNKNMTLEPDTEMLLFCADRAEHQSRVLALLEGGASVVCDRFLSSTWAYQIFGRGLDPALLEAIAPHTIKRYPDLTIILDMDLDTALERANARLQAEGKTIDEGRFEAERREFFENVQRGFRWYANEARFGKSVIVNASGDIDEVTKKIQEVVCPLL